MNRTSTVTVIAILLGSLSGSAVADTVELRDGTLVKGKYVGGTAGTIRIEQPEGVKVLQTADVLALTFESAPAAAQPAGSATPPPATPAAPQAISVNVPAGSILTIRLDQAVSSKDPEGKKFTGKLLADLVADGATVAKAGSTVHGQVDKSKQARRLAGKSELEFSLSGIDISGRIQPIATTNFSEAGKGEFRKTARNTAGGALIGHAADDDDGAGVGAAIGAGVSLIRKGDAVTAPAGMLLEFRLTQPFQASATP